ncbi:hypothetical protein ScPMuIL_001410 [Solemya velum]
MTGGLQTTLGIKPDTRCQRRGSWQPTFDLRKSSDVKCDVEISITSDGEEIETLYLPPALQAAALLGYSSPPQNDHVNPVSLPCRYSRLIDRNAGSTNEENDSRDIQTRENDLTTALKWIKQEIFLMKEQDKSLMKQFIDIRSSILELRCFIEMYSSNSDISSFGGSTFSLDDLGSPSPVNSPGVLSSPDVDVTEFRSRSASLLSPKHSPITRIKWKSNEYI